MCSLPVWSFVTIRFASLINLPASSLNAINASRSWKLHDSAASDQIPTTSFSFLFFFYFFFQFYSAWRARAHHTSQIKIDRFRGIPACKSLVRSALQSYDFATASKNDRRRLFFSSLRHLSRDSTELTRSKTEYASVRSFHGRCSGSRPRIYTYLTRRWIIKYYGTWKDRIKSYVQRKRRVR